MAEDWRSRARDMLVVLLSVTTGAVDAAAFLHLGHVFSSVVTGTMVLLGVAAGTHNPALAENCAVALASYVAGVLSGRRSQPGAQAAGWSAGGAAGPMRRPRCARSGHPGSPSRSPWNSPCS